MNQDLLVGQEGPSHMRQGRGTFFISASPSVRSSVSSRLESAENFAPIRSSTPELDRATSGTRLTDEEIFRTLSHRFSHVSGYDTGEEDWAQIERLISRMFGKERQMNSEEEKNRHVGVVWKNLTVKGRGLGATLQPTNGDIFLALPRLMKGLLIRGRKGAGTGKLAIRTILDDFTVEFSSLSKKIPSLTSPRKGCVRPREMLLVLGRPGSGCSTFLKILGNQRAGYQSIRGDVRYGGIRSETMARNYRSEGNFTSRVQSTGLYTHPISPL